MEHTSLRRTALSATVHCLTGCAIGEVLGLIIGQALDWHNVPTIILSIALAFLFGYGLSLRTVLKAGLAFKVAFGIVLAADTLSITTMEIVDNIVMASISGAMEAGLTNPVFWWSMPISLGAAFLAAYPVNLYLLKRGKGHALMHEHHGNHDDQPGHKQA